MTTPSPTARDFTKAAIDLANRQLATINDACRRAIETGESQHVVLRVTVAGETASERHVVIAMPEMRRYEADRIEDFPTWLREALK